MKHKLLSILLTLCLAFSLLPTAALADEGQDPVAQIGETTYATLKAAFEGAEDGDTVTLLKDAELTETLNITKATTLDGANHKITGKPSTGETSFITVKTDGDFTMKNATILPTSKVEKNSAIDLQVKGKVVVDNCVFGAADDANQFMYNGLEFSQSRDYPMADGTTISNCTFYGGSFRHNFISFYRMAEGATININGNKFLNTNWDTTNAIRVSNYSNVNATINLLDNTYNDHGADENKDYAGLLIFQETSANNDKFTTLTVNIKNLDTTGAQSNQLFYVYKDGAGIISTNQPVVKGDSSIEKFFVAKVGDTYYKTLADAITAAKGDGKTIVLLKDITATGAISAASGETFTIDLNGHTYARIRKGDVASVYPGIYVNGGNLTIADSSANGTGKVINEVVAGANSGAQSNGAYVSNNGSLTMTGGAIEAKTCYRDSFGVAVFSGSTFTMENGSVSAGGFGITGNGIAGVGNTHVIIKNGTVTGGALGIYQPQNGELIISGGTIIGGTGIEIKSGNVTIEITGNPTISATGTPTHTPSSNGNSTSGYSIAAVENHNYGGSATVSIGSGSYKGEVKILQDNEVEENQKATISITGGLFSSDPSAYCAEGKTGVASGNSQYPYTVGDKDANAKPAHVDTATVPAKTAGDASQDVKDVASEITGANVTNNAAEAATKDLANKNKLTGNSVLEDNTTVVGKLNIATGGTTEAENVAIVYQTYVDVVVSDATADSNGKITELEVNLTPMYRVVATTSDVVNGDQKIIVEGDTGVNAVVIQEGKKLNLPEQEYEVKLALPDGFAVANAKLSIKHTKGNGTVEYYTGVVSADGKSVTFTTKGFSPFTISAPAASIGETMYPTLAEAIAKAANGNTVKLEKDCDESVSVSGKSLTIDKHGKNYNFDKVSVDSNSTKTVSEDGKTLTITYTAPSSSSGSSGYYVSTPSKTENGSVTVSPRYADKGDTVTVTVKPNSGYVLETLTVTDKNGNELTLKDKGNGKYTFTMPAGKVEVKATFMEDNSMLNFFYDVPNNAYFYEAVKWAVKNGITTGVGNDLFAPEQPCTRAQIVTFLWRAAGSPEPKGAASGMTDVVSGSYYEKAVAWAIENGITTGTTTTTFSPDATCTRAQAVTFLARALKAKAESAAEFSDVPTGSYFADAVAWAAANGVTEGIGGGLFGSDNDCTRGQIVTFLYRAYNK